jgi:hypothetical protein
VLNEWYYSLEGKTRQMRYVGIITTQGAGAVLPLTGLETVQIENKEALLNINTKSQN